MGLVRNDQMRLQIDPYNPFATKLPVPVAGIFDKPCTCVRINVEWRKYIYSLLDILDQPDIWDTDDEAIIQELRDQVGELRASMATCNCGSVPPGETIWAGYRLELLIEFTANGLDGIAPTRPDTTWDTDTGDTGDEIHQRENALCNACLDYVNTVSADIQHRADTIGLASGGFGVVLFAAFPIAGVIFAAASVLITAAVLLALKNENARILVACCMRDALVGQAINEANFQAALSACGFGALSNEEILRFAIDATLNDTGNYLAFVASLGAFFTASDAATVCPCDPPLTLVINPGLPFTVPMVLEDLGAGSWRATSGVWDHPTSGLSAVISVTREGGGCFDIVNSVLISGSVDLTSWTPCGGGSASNPGSSPQDRPNVEAWAVQDAADIPTFVIEFDAIEP